MTRNDLVTDQGVAVSDADALRIVRAMDSARAALEETQRSLFDTEPAHFDRWQEGASR